MKQVNIYDIDYATVMKYFEDEYMPDKDDKHTLDFADRLTIILDDKVRR